jgi:hypothetical protein
MASFQFSYEVAPSWPRLAWAALCENGSSSIPVIHGPAVDRGENWFSEAVWDGPFSEGNLDQTDLVFGSGARCRRDGVTFVSSAATVDRLQVSVRGNRTFVSNSLPWLLAVIGARLDPAFRGYADLFLSVTRGLDECRISRSMKGLLFSSRTARTCAGTATSCIVCRSALSHETFPTSTTTSDFSGQRSSASAKTWRALSERERTRGWVLFRAATTRQRAHYSPEKQDCVA